jgi:hypothetical protein
MAMPHRRVRMSIAALASRWNFGGSHPFPPPSHFKITAQRQMAQLGGEGRRMGALRAGFARALEGATGACGLEARGATARRALPHLPSAGL